MLTCKKKGPKSVCGHRRAGMLLGVLLKGGEMGQGRLGSVMELGLTGFVHYCCGQEGTEQVEQVGTRGAFAHGHEYGVGSRDGSEYKVGP